MAKSFQGVSTNTVITEDLAYILDDAEFVSASDNGVLNGTILTWYLGDLGCKGERTVSFTVKVRDNPLTPGLHTNTAIVDNATNEPTYSNPVDVVINAPELNISVTDNTNLAVPGDILTYVITVTNSGTGRATEVCVVNTIPEYLLQLNDTLSPGGIVIGDNLAKWCFDIGPGETLQFTVQALVTEEIPEGYSNVIDVAVLANDGIEKDASDTTQVFRTVIPDPNFALFVSCTEEIGGKQVIRFGYENYNQVEQPLTFSIIEPEEQLDSPLQVLLPGRHERAFAISRNIGSSATWKAGIDDYLQEVSLGADVPNCANRISTPDEPRVPIYPPVETFINAPLVQTAPSVAQPNFPPRVTMAVSGNENLCESKKILINNCNIQDSDGAVTAVQYSLDDGQTWLPVQTVSGLGSSTASCVFSTTMLPDGKYNLRVRSLDNNGNIGISEPATVVVDCNGLVIGSSQFNQYGVLSPMSITGEVQSILGASQFMAIAVAGGPVEVIVTAEKGDISLEFPLAYNWKTEIWEGDLKLDQPGVYQLLVTAREQDGTTVARYTNPLEVIGGLLITNERGETVPDAKIEVFYRDNPEARWESWNGDSSEGAQLVLEPGRYYIQVSAPGYYTTTSREFAVDRYSYVSSQISIYSKASLFNLFAALGEAVSVSTISQDQHEGIRRLLDQTIPDLQVKSGNETLTHEQIISSNQPTVLVTWTDWDTPSSAQWSILSELFVQSKEKGFQMLPVGLLEGEEENKAVITRGRYTFPVYKPVDSSFYDDWQVISAPQYYFIDPKGILRQVRTGNMTLEEIKKEVDNLLLLENDSEQNQ